MPALLFLICFIVAPAVLTHGLVRLALWLRPQWGRGRILRTVLPMAAILPLLPFGVMIARYDGIDNAVPIGVVVTALAALVVGLCVCLPVGLGVLRRQGL